MNTVFEVDTIDTIDILKSAMSYHPELDGLDVKFKIVKVRKYDKDDEPVVPSLKCHGGAAAGTIKVNGLKQRHLTGVDVVIELDGHVWESLPKLTRLALIDHELTHLVLVTDTDGKPKVDDLGRPKFKLRPDDWMLTGFASVISRHGRHALEYQSVTRINLAAEAAKKACDAAVAVTSAVVGQGADQTDSKVAA